MIENHYQKWALTERCGRLTEANQGRLEVFREDIEATILEELISRSHDSSCRHVCHLAYHVSYSCALQREFKDYNPCAVCANIKSLDCRSLRSMVVQKQHAGTPFSLIVKQSGRTKNNRREQ